ncbi:TPA: RodZ domain-containing protein [Haemophilus influenzae]|uniref:RodZ domain-containing protein n=1 Tax=Haemophilus influenzae TaxID=727 RepID=UPI000D01535E|nr:RodZ family helix-turn-helix domain-containing protein [Haemophilus influenzae]MCK8796258.1 helix-turn-helix domain-containing protein [Haemophilus influenzae]MCK8800620.1 helix-turn-helix domain-containing protein [Haemophilus influenzae]MCK8812919.1 helix-turn-helix domain-containing protein [Haemophilus influenzae]MCK8849229.1 helix-turn-helix domain-containing protein [Haemophilus influenzae]MCK8892782.1 helix-turn-helix domain-containing protein [Haemophilus influenzae]
MNPTTEQVLSPGEIFRQTREALNLSLEDVAKEITLRPSILEQLENNEFIQKSTPSIFVKGYVRSYAKFLRLPDSVWENIVFAETEKNDLGKNARSTRAVNQYSSHNRWIGRLTAIVFVIVIGMTGLWWWQSYQQNTQERDDLVQSYVASTENNQPATALVTTEESNKSAPETAAPLSQPVEITNNVLPEIAQENSVSLLKNNEKSVSDIQSAVENPSISPTLPIAKGDLVIEILTNSSWISVKDNARHVLAQKEYKQGEILTFNGNEFSLIIGAPSNVRITYKGENYPLKVDGRVAKFKLSQP